MVKLYLVEEQPVLYEKKETLFSPEDGINLIGNSRNGDVNALVDKLSALSPDVLLMGANQLDKIIIGELEQIRLKLPEIGVVLLVLSYIPPDVQLLRRAMLRNGGGLAVLLRASMQQVDELGMIILAVSQGQVVFDPELATFAWSGEAWNSFIGQLTVREMEILDLLAKGYNNSAIADSLYIDIKTVENHLSNIYSKLRANVDFNRRHQRVSAARIYLEATGKLVTNWRAERRGISAELQPKLSV